MLALLVLTARFVEPMTEAGMLGSTVQRTRDALARFAEVLAAEPLPEPAEPQRPGTFGITFDPGLVRLRCRRRDAGAAGRLL